MSASRKEGKTTGIRIKSLAGEPCILRTDMVNPIVKAGNVTLTPIGQGEYSLDLKKGENVVLTTAEENIPMISPVNGKGQNFFGLQQAKK